MRQLLLRVDTGHTQQLGTVAGKVVQKVTSLTEETTKTALVSLVKSRMVPSEKLSLTSIREAVGRFSGGCAAESDPLHGCQSA